MSTFYVPTYVNSQLKVWSQSTLLRFTTLHPSCIAVTKVCHSVTTPAVAGWTGRPYRVQIPAVLADHTECRCRLYWLTIHRVQMPTPCVQLLCFHSLSLSGDSSLANNLALPPCPGFAGSTCHTSCHSLTFTSLVLHTCGCPPSLNPLLPEILWLYVFLLLLTWAECRMCLYAKEVSPSLEAFTAVRVPRPLQGTVAQLLYIAPSCLEVALIMVCNCWLYWHWYVSHRGCSHHCHHEGLLKPWNQSLSKSWLQIQCSVFCSRSGSLKGCKILYSSLLLWPYSTSWHCC